MHREVAPPSTAAEKLATLSRACAQTAGGKARTREGDATATNSPDASTVQLEASYPEEEVAHMLSITYPAAQRLSMLGGFRMSDFCDPHE